MPKIDDVEIIRIPKLDIIGINCYVWVPKWPWFRPPKTKFFKWAYHVVPANRNQQIYLPSNLEKIMNEYAKREGTGNESDDGNNVDDSWTRNC